MSFRPASNHCSLNRLQSVRVWYQWNELMIAHAFRDVTMCAATFNFLCAERPVEPAWTSGEIAQCLMRPHSLEQELQFLWS